MTESDRELLELAAKAAGLRVTWEPVHSCYWVDLGQGLVHEPWEPLKNDGQALRLAVKLQLTIKFHYGLVLIGNEKKLLADEADEDYKYAIVRAAAAIARATHKEQI